MDTSLSSGLSSGLAPGNRCRANRSITHPGGTLHRSTPGTIVATRENIGRQLITVSFDGGPRLVLFAHELDAYGEDEPS